MEIWQNLSLENLQVEFEGIIYTEEWRDIPSFEGIYQISSFGRIKILKRKIKHSRGNNFYYENKEKIKKQHLNKFLGYLYVTFTDKNNKTVNKRVNRIVAEIFIPNPENKPEVNHKNTIKTNNFFLNLEWNTSLENTTNIFKNGHPAKRVKLKLEDIPLIKELYKTGNYTYAQLGEIYGTKRKAIMRAVLGQTWNFNN